MVYVSLSGISVLPRIDASGGRTVPGFGARPPIVIAHRGASGYRPEHTLASYELAIRLGAEFIEPDLVSTRDGVLVARHENELSGTTDIATRPEFTDRRTTKVVDGFEASGWFVEDLTLAEVKTLRALERLPEVRPGNTRYDGRFEVPTFDEVLELATTESRRRGHPVGVYPETKNPTYFASLGLSLNEPLVRSLRAHSLDRPGAPVFVQSYETANLRELAAMSHVRLVQLLDVESGPYDLLAAGEGTTYADMVTPVGLREIATYAHAIGPDKELLLPWSVHGTVLRHTGLVDRAHEAGLLVHAYTLRDENRYLPVDFRIGDSPDEKGDAFSEYEILMDLGVDGFFADYTDTAVQARDWWHERRIA